MKIKNKIIEIIIFLNISLILLVDLLHLIIKDDYLGKIGGGLWIFSYILVFGYSFYSLFKIIKISFKIKSFVSLLSLFFIIFIVLLNTVNPKNISNETTQETACGINHILILPDMGFWKTCLFGYPARQYYLSSLPSIIIGRSLFSLNFGGSLYFLVGLPIFTYGIWQLTSHKKIYDYIIGTLLVSFFHIYSFNFFMFNYEQSIFPFSLTLIIAGLFMSYFNKKNKVTILLIWLVSEYLIYSYSPSIAVYGLCILILIYFLITVKSKFLYFIIVTSSLCSLYLSLKNRYDLVILDTATRVYSILLKDLSDALTHLIIQNKGIPLTSSIFYFIFIFFLFGSLFYVFGWQNFIVAFWMVGVFVFSVLSKGYSYYGIDYRLNRILIIFPVLFILILEIIKKFINENIKLEVKNHFLIPFLFLFIFITGYVYHSNYLQQKEISRYYQLVRWLSKQSFVAKKSILLVETVEYGSLNDSLLYFLPNTEGHALFDDCVNYKETKKDLYLLTTNVKENDCNKYFSKMNFINQFQFEKNTLSLYKVDN
ncbi:MAG: hypothetical protein WC744_01480 [Patescibacteria group bacterium]|jgi:hypothetical protein